MWLHCTNLPRNVLFLALTNTTYQTRQKQRSYGKFLRRFQLPDGVDPDKITANFNNGLLYLDVPKLPQQQQKQKVRQIPIAQGSAVEARRG